MIWVFSLLTAYLIPLTGCKGTGLVSPSHYWSMPLPVTVVAWRFHYWISRDTDSGQCIWFTFYFIQFIFLWTSKTERVSLSSFNRATSCSRKFSEARVPASAFDRGCLSGVVLAGAVGTCRPAGLPNLKRFGVLGCAQKYFIHCCFNLDFVSGPFKIANAFY